MKEPLTAAGLWLIIIVIPITVSQYHKVSFTCGRSSHSRSSSVFTCNMFISRLSFGESWSFSGRETLLYPWWMEMSFCFPPLPFFFFLFWILYFFDPFFSNTSMHPFHFITFQININPSKCLKKKKKNDTNANSNMLFPLIHAALEPLLPQEWQPLLGFCRIKPADLNAKPISQASLTARAGDDK